MAIKVLRKKSSTPNITNRMDARMIRYAYGGEDGIIKNYGNEFRFEIMPDASIAKIQSGIFVFQGWEIEEESSWQYNAPAIGSFKHLIYLELNLISESAEIKTIAVPISETTPTINPGDDLTESTNGIARIELYYIESVDGRFRNLKNLCKKIEYANETFNKVEQKIKRTEPVLIFNPQSPVSLNSTFANKYVKIGTFDNIRNKTLCFEIGDYQKTKLYYCKLNTGILTIDTRVKIERLDNVSQKDTSKIRFFVQVINLKLEIYGNQTTILGITYEDEIGLRTSLGIEGGNSYDFVSFGRTKGREHQGVYKIWIMPEEYNNEL